MNSQASSCMRTFEFLMEKYKDEVALNFKVNRGGAHIEQAEHDQIIYCYHKLHTSIGALSRRHNRAKGTISRIVHFKHKLYKKT